MTPDQQLAANLTTTGRPGSWWIEGLAEPMGPYSTRTEADEDRAGVQRFLRHQHRRGFVTTDAKGG